MIPFIPVFNQQAWKKCCQLCNLILGKKYVFLQFWCCCLCDAQTILVIVLILVLFSLQCSCFFLCSILMLLFVQCSCCSGHCFDLGVVLCLMLLLFCLLFQFWCCFLVTLLLFLLLFQFGVVVCGT